MSANTSLTWVLRIVEDRLCSCRAERGERSHQRNTRICHDAYRAGLKIVSAAAVK